VVHGANHFFEGKLDELMDEVIGPYLDEALGQGADR